METNDLSLFKLVVESGSFSAAARELDLETSTVSRRIAALEADLRCRLFDRSTRRMRLTQAGQTVLDRCAEPLSTLELLREDVRADRDCTDGLVRITASTTFGERWLVPKLSGFATEWPAIQFDLQLSDQRVDLSKARMDIALRMGAPDGVAADASTEKIMTTRYRVVASPDYLRANPVQEPEELTQRSCICFALPGFRTSWRFRRSGYPDEDVPITSGVSVSGAGGVLAAALAGLGPALLADWTIADALQAGELVDLFPQYEVSAGNFESAIWMIVPGGRTAPRRVRLVAEHLRSGGLR